MTTQEERESASRDRKRKEQRTINAYHVIFAGPDGDLVLRDLTSAFGINHPAFLSTATTVGGNLKYDPFYAAIRDGQRSVYLHIMAKLSSHVTGDANIEEGDKVLTGLSE